MFMTFLYCIVSFLLRLRYRVTVRGKEVLEEVRGKGALFLPNHPAEIDPVIVMMCLWRASKPRPLIVDTFYWKKGIHFFMRCVRALAVPDLDKGRKNGWKVHKLREVFEQTADGLKKGDHFLIYPSGRLKLEQKEKLGGASFVYNLLQECPDATLVLIRTRGLWGSRFSRAVTGHTPSFGGVLKEGLFLLLKNGIFFMPKREVYVDIEIAPASFPRHLGRLTCNAYLEEWYNRVPDPLQRVSDCFWKTAYALCHERVGPVSEIEIPKDIERAVLEKIGALVSRPVEEIKREQDLFLDLGLDSLDSAQIYLFMDAAYDVDRHAFPAVRTVFDVMKVSALAAGSKTAQPAHIPEVKKSSTCWAREKTRPAPRMPEAKTIQEAFVSTCLYMKGHIACADEVTGVWSYRKLLFVAQMLSRRFEAFPEQYVGVMLPASVSAYLVIMALLLANKVPVMLNWTTGVRALDHAFTLTDMKRVISSDKFLDRIQQTEWGKVLEHLLCLEEIKNTISWKDKLHAVLGLFCLKKADLFNEEACAVLLFTSGTESLPKAVPLTHKNILSNQRASLECVELESQDTFYCMLPPFHSFGFSVTGLLPLLAGIRAYYAPDPTDTRRIVEEIISSRPTLLCSAPSFLQNIFQCAEPENLASLRLVVSGAEKLPDKLSAYVAKECPWIELLEGYGITECSPIVTLNRPGKTPVGVGLPVPGIELKIIEQQEVCICGPNVFSGYLKTSSSCFLEEGGKTWYRSGDRGVIDAEGHLILLGRLKRFVKIGGEMVSLLAIEEAVMQGVNCEKNEPSIAVSAREKEGEKTTITLFTTLSQLTKENANQILIEAGFSTLIKIGFVQRLEQIPLTGTGKIHYRSLEEMVSCV